MFLKLEISLHHAIASRHPLFRVDRFMDQCGGMVNQTHRRLARPAKLFLRPTPLTPELGDTFSNYIEIMLPVEAK
jgi:hypothetical protein